MEVQTYSVLLRRKDGSMLWMLFNSTPSKIVVGAFDAGCEAVHIQPIPTLRSTTNERPQAN